MKLPLFPASKRGFAVFVGLLFVSGILTAFKSTPSRNDSKTAVLSTNTRGTMAKLPVGYFRLRNAKSGKYLAIGAGDPNQKNAIQWSDVRQKDINWATDGERIWNAQTGGVIGAKNATDNLVEHKLLDYECYTENPQNSKWDLAKQADGTYWIQVRSVGKYLGIEAGATSDGNKAIFQQLSPWKQGLPIPTLPKEFCWYLEPVFINRYKLSIKTGGDDLRDGSCAYAQIGGREFLLGTSASPNTFMRLNPINYVVGQNSLSANASFAIRHDGEPRKFPDTYDNWDMEKIEVFAITNFGCEIKVLSSDGVRFTGNLRKKVFYLNAPFYFSPYCEPG